jgi:polysaccharide export outer membrane protein
MIETGMKVKFMTSLSFSPNVVAIRRYASAVALLLVASHTAHAEYRLDIGDILDVSVFGVAELRAHSRIGIDGEISFPLLGEIQVAGLTVPQLRSKLQILLDEQVSHKTSSGPDTASGRIGVNEVTIDIAEYRPIYVNGDIARAGEQSFRPGMTARQAILLCGGYDLARGRMNSSTTPTDLETDYDAMSVEFAREKAHIWRVENELADQGGRSPPEMPKVAISRDLFSQIIEAETDILKSDETNYRNEVSQLAASARDTDAQLTSLDDQIKRQKAELDLDTQDLAKIRQLSDKNLITMDRLSGERHQVFQATTQFFQSTAQRAQLQKERGDLDMRLDKLTGDHHVALVRELEDADIKLATIRTRLQAAGEKLGKAGTVADGGSRSSSITVTRRQDQTSTTFVATEDTTLMPGDVVQVLLGSESEANVAQQ